MFALSHAAMHGRCAAVAASRAFSTPAAATTAGTAAAAASASAAARAATPAPVDTAAWGPKSRLLAPSLPVVSRRVSRSKRSPDAPVVPRQLPLKYARLENDHPLDQRQQHELHAAVIVERWPKIMREEQEWRAEYRQHFAELRAKKNVAHAIPDELQNKELAEKEAGPSDPVNPEDLLTEADRANDLHATHRCLQDSLFLVVKRRGGAWAFPSGPVPFDLESWQKHTADPAAVLAARSVAEAAALLLPPPPKHTLRTVAADTIASTIGTHAGVYFMGNAPIAVQRVKKPVKPAADAPATALPLVGTKTFFMHALYMDGEVRLQNAREWEDYAWVKKEELPKYIGAAQADILLPVLLDAEV